MPQGGDEGHLVALPDADDRLAGLAQAGVVGEDLEDRLVVELEGGDPDDLARAVEHRAGDEGRRLAHPRIDLIVGQLRREAPPRPVDGRGQLGALQGAFLDLRPGVEVGLEAEQDIAPGREEEEVGIPEALGHVRQDRPELVPREAGLGRIGPPFPKASSSRVAAWTIDGMRATPVTQRSRSRAYVSSSSAFASEMTIRSRRTESSSARVESQEVRTARRPQGISEMARNQASSRPLMVCPLKEILGIAMCVSTALMHHTPREGSLAHGGHQTNVSRPFHVA